MVRVITRFAIELPEVPCDGEFGIRLSDREDIDFTYAGLQASRVQEWTDVVSAYENNPGDFYNAWHYLNWHPAFWKFYGSPDDPHADRFHEKCLVEDRGVEHCVEISVAKVNPASGSIDDDPALNTKTEVWAEIGMLRWPSENFREYDVHIHDYNLDCGGDTYEQAITNMARLVHDKYGNDRQVCDEHRDTPKKLGEDNDT